MSLVESCDSLFGKTGLSAKSQQMQPIIVKDGTVVGKRPLAIPDRRFCDRTMRCFLPHPNSLTGRFAERTYEITARLTGARFGARLTPLRSVRLARRCGVFR